jgi:hypothetical protein
MTSGPTPPGPRATLSRGWKVLTALLALATVAGGAVLFLFDPAQYGFYPFCLFHRLTGLNCPGCGGLRALHQLAHGHLATAFRLNALVVLGLPIGAWLGARWLRRRASGPPQPPLGARPIWLWTILAVLMVFGILRNLPVPLLARLSP